MFAVLSCASASCRIRAWTGASGLAASEGSPFSLLDGSVIFFFKAEPFVKGVTYCVQSTHFLLSQSPSKEQGGCSELSHTRCRDTCVTVFRSSTKEIPGVRFPCGTLNGMCDLFYSIPFSSVYDANIDTLGGFFILSAHLRTDCGPAHHTSMYWCDGRGRDGFTGGLSW